MVRIERNFLLNLDVVYPFQNSEPVPHAHDGHLLQFLMSQRHQSFADNFVFYPNTN